MKGPTNEHSVSESQLPSIHVLTTPDRIKQQYLNLVRGALDEALLIFPTINAIHREFKIGILDELKNAVKRGVKIRILSAEDDFIKARLDELRASGIIIRRIETPTEAKFKMLIVDKKVAYIVETKDDSRSEFQDAVGTAIFSNSKATVQPYVTIFESFWRETDLYERARESDRIKDEFVHVAAHELRTPIMPIVSGAEFMNALISGVKDKLDPQVLDEMSSNSRLIIRNAVKLLRLSEDILQVSRLENGTFSLNLEPGNIDDMIESAAADVKQKYEEGGTKVKLIVDPRLKLGAMRIICDPAKVSQTLTNLIDNAMKFTSEGEVVVSCSVSDNEIIFSVKDSGTGVAEDIRDRLFEKFVSKSNTGTGLGLYLAKKIVEAHGGRIWFEDNSSGQGTTFSFVIPLDLSLAITSESAEHETADKG